MREKDSSVSFLQEGETANLKLIFSGSVVTLTGHRLQFLKGLLPILIAPSKRCFCLNKDLLRLWTGAATHFQKLKAEVITRIKKERGQTAKGCLKLFKMNLPIS